MSFIQAFLDKNGNLMLFLLLIAVSIGLIVKNQNYPKSQFYSTLFCWQSQVEENVSNAKAYFHLKEDNQLLINENRKLKQQNFNIKEQNNSILRTYRDTLKKSEIYELVSANIVSTISRGENNYYTVNRGYVNGVQEGLGVITDKGIIGHIAFADKEYSAVLSILHPLTKIKGRIRNSQIFGTLIWKGEDSRIMHLLNIDKYINVNVKDTIETFQSRVYPEGIPIGAIVDKKIDVESGDWDITVQLFQDMNNIRNVYIVKNFEKVKIDTLEKKTESLDVK